jgi:hypothetical protein
MDLSIDFIFQIKWVIQMAMYGIGAGKQEFKGEWMSGKLQVCCRAHILTVAPRIEAGIVQLRDCVFLALRVCIRCVGAKCSSTRVLYAQLPAIGQSIGSGSGRMAPVPEKLRRNIGGF